MREGKKRGASAGSGTDLKMSKQPNSYLTGNFHFYSQKMEEFYKILCFFGGKRGSFKIKKGEILWAY